MSTDPRQTTEAAKIAASLDAAKRIRWPYVDEPRQTPKRPGRSAAAAELAPPPRPLVPGEAVDAG